MPINWNEFDKKNSVKGTTYAPQDLDSRKGNFNIATDDLIPNTRSHDKFLESIVGDPKNVVANPTKDDPWWKEALYGIHGVGGVITNELAKATNDKKGDIPLADTLANIGKGQLKAWSDGEIGFKDIPLFGGLVEAGKNHKQMQDVFDNLGWEQGRATDEGWNFFDRREGNFDYQDLLGFAGDVAFDPLTYATLGGSSALKLGKIATKQSMDDVARKYGVKAGKTPEETATNVASKYMGMKGINPSLADRAAEKTYNKVLDEITNAGKAAREKGQNNLINFDVWGADIAKGFGTKPDFLKVKDAKVGENGANAVSQLFSDLGLLDRDKQGDLLQSAFGTRNADELTSQQFDHLDNVLRGTDTSKVRNLPDREIQDELVRLFKPNFDQTVTYNKFDVDDFLNKVDPRVADKIAPLVRGLDQDGIDKLRNLAPEAIRSYSDFYKKISGTAKGKTLKNAQQGFNRVADDIGKVSHTASIKFDPFTSSQQIVRTTNPIDNSLDKTTRFIEKELGKSKFVQDMGGSSVLGRMLKNSLAGKLVNSRTLGSTDEFVNQAAGKIQDAESRIRSNMGKMSYDIKNLQRMSKGLSKDDLENIPYIIEKKYPNGKTEDEFLKDVTDKEKLMKVAEATKKMLDDFANSEARVGNLKDRLKNYFPHVIRPDQIDKDTLLEIMSRPEMQKYMGRSSANKFDQARKSFPSFAAWDEAITELEKGLQKASPDEAAKIQENLRQLENLFERNTFEALKDRYVQNVYRTAMKDLQNQLTKDGLLIPEGKMRGSSNNFKKIEGETAKRLGIKEGTFIHKEVLKGLQKVEGLFTDEGVEKFANIAMSATNVWKSLVTTYNPVHHTYNLIGNIANNMMAGVKQKHYTQATRILWKFKKGKKLSEAEERVLKEAYDNGALSGGEMVEMFDPIIQKRGKIESFVTDNGYARFMRNKLGNNVDDFTRLALYLRGKEAFNDPKLASQLVRKYLFNYGEMTTGDKGIRFFVPFWNWTKNNVPLQIMEFMRQPRFYSTFTKLQETLKEGYEEENIPSWLEDGLKVPWKENDFANLRLPQQDLTNIDDPVKFLTNSLALGVKAPFELAMNKQMFNNAPIDPYKLDGSSITDYDPKELGDYVMNQLGIVNRVKGFMESNEDEDLLDKIRNSILPKSYEIDPEKQQDINAYLQREINSLAKKKERDREEAQ